MKNKAPMKLKIISFIHNLMLSVSSAILFLAITSEVIPSLANDGLFLSVCGTKIFNGRLDYFYYINYWFKLYELFDTIILVLKKHQLSFLHVYHHCLTFILVFTQFNGQATVVRVA